MQRTKLILMALFSLLALSACGKIPSAYRGDYTDAATGAKLTLKGGSGILTAAPDRILEADANNLDFEALEKGEPGIYVRPDELNPDIIEVYWLTPKKDTRKEEQSFVWMETEVLYSRMDSKAEKDVQSLQVTHCEKGLLMLDLPTKTWNGGCPAERTDYQFVRNAEK